MLSCGLSITEDGRVYGPDGVERSQYDDGTYLKVGYKQKFYKVHRLMAEAFLGELDKTVNHKDGNKLNNKLGNLEMVTLLDNLEHAFENNLHCNPRHPVRSIHKETGQVTEYPSVMDAVRSNPKAHNANIYRAIRHGRTCVDCYWEFYQDEVQK